MNTKIRMCKACEVTFREQVRGVPVSYAEYTSECLAETGKVGDWLNSKGYCQENYAFPLCNEEAFDPVAHFEGPELGVPRAIRLEGLGSRQTDKTDFRPPKNGECLCMQGPEPCACRDTIWANRQGF